MSNPNPAIHSFKGEALILISGLGNPEATAKARGVLSSYNLQILDQQSISIKGRLIAAFHIALDPAHAAAIEKELVETFTPLNLDIAIDLI